MRADASASASDIVLLFPDTVFPAGGFPAKGSLVGANADCHFTRELLEDSD
jgi:hypothetical protein